MAEGDSFVWPFAFRPKLSNLETSGETERIHRHEARPVGKLLGKPARGYQQEQDALSKTRKM